MRKLRKACRPIAVIVKGPKIAPRHLREPAELGDAKRVHLSGALWPTLYTLCGRRRIWMGGIASQEMETCRAKVNCPECMAVIEHVLQEAGK